MDLDSRLSAPVDSQQLSAATQASILSASRGGVWGERRWLTVGLLLIVTLVAFELLAVATVMPTVRDELGGVRLYGWVFSAFLLSSIVGIVWAGERCDSRGPLLPFLGGLVFFSAGLVIAGLAPSMAVLVLGRSVQGVGAGALPAVAWVGIGRGYDEASRPRLLALTSTAWVVPGLTGPGIAAAVAETLGWRLVFLGLLPLVLIAGWLAAPGLRHLGPPENPMSGPRRLVPAIQLAGGAALVLAGVSAPSPILVAPLVAGGAAIAWRPLLRLLPAGTLRLARGMPSAIAGHAVLNLAFVCGDAFVPFALVTVRGRSTLLVGAALSVSTITWTAGTWGIERLANRVPRQQTVVVGLALVAVEMAAMVASVLPHAPVALAIVAWCVGTLGMGIAYPSFTLTIIGGARPGEEGAASAAMKLAESLATGVGAGLGGALVAAGIAMGSDARGVALAFAFACLAALLGTIPAWRSKQRGEPDGGPS